MKLCQAHGLCHVYTSMNRVIRFVERASNGIGNMDQHVAIPSALLHADAFHEGDTHRGVRAVAICLFFFLPTHTLLIC